MCKGPINGKNISLNVRDINVDAVPQYASFLSKNDIKGIYGNYWIKKYLNAEYKFTFFFSFKVNGTTGEGILSLTVDERMELAEAWMKEKDKVPTQIMQVGGCAFRDAQKLVRFYKKEVHEIQPTSMSPIPKFTIFFCSVPGCSCWEDW